MRKPRHSYFVDKAIEAAISAIEIYNKPIFRYRAETFAILMLNAWELLLKARILKENNNLLRSIEVWTQTTGKNGAPRLTPKRNRAGNTMTVGIGAAAKIVQEYNKDSIDRPGVENILLLMEIRDNAIHFHNTSRGLRQRVQEIGAAALRNFAYASKTWFKRGLEEYEFALMPFAFESPTGIIQTVFADDEKGAAGKLQKLFVEMKQAFPFDPKNAFNVGVEVELRFVRNAKDGAIAVRIAPDDPSAIAVTLSEEDARRSFPWTYTDLRKFLRERYTNFKENDQFHKLRKPLEKNSRYCHVRLLDPKNARTQKQKFYNPNIVAIFDEHYKLKEKIR